MKLIKRFIAVKLALIWSNILQIFQQNNPIKWEYEAIQQVNLSFSQFGEDIVIGNLLKEIDPSQGIYVDVGAFHPITFSNTMLLYKKGWRGLNIDLNTEKINSFKALRPFDCNVVAAISDQKRTAKLLKYIKSATDRITLSEENLKSVLGEEPVEISEVETLTLTEVIEKKSPFCQKSIHYLNIDCEGHDIQVLKSLDFNKYSPKVITIEIFEDDDLINVKSYLSEKGYILDSSIHYTRFFVLKNKTNYLNSNFNS